MIRSILKVVIFFVIMSAKSFAAEDKATTGSLLPGVGIQIVPREKMDLPYKLSAEKNALLKRQQIELGYQPSQKTAYQENLFSLRKHIDSSYYRDGSDPYDTHLKASLSLIPLAFYFSGLPLVKEGDVIGYTPTGAWNQNGWTGIVEFFQAPEFGICEYMLINLKLNEGGVLLPEESVTYQVNERPTLIYVSGNELDGFLYKVAWFDDRAAQYLRCANKNFDRNITDTLINFAKEIDYIKSDGL